MLKCLGLREPRKVWMPLLGTGIRPICRKSARGAFFLPSLTWLPPWSSTGRIYTPGASHCQLGFRLF